MLNRWLYAHMTESLHLDILGVMFFAVHAVRAAKSLDCRVAALLAMTGTGVIRAESIVVCYGWRCRHAFTFVTLLLYN